MSSLHINLCKESGKGHWRYIVILSMYLYLYVYGDSYACVVACVYLHTVMGTYDRVCIFIFTRFFPLIFVFILLKPFSNSRSPNAYLNFVHLRYIFILFYLILFITIYFLILLLILCFSFFYFIMSYSNNSSEYNTKPCDLTSFATTCCTLNVFPCPKI